MNTDKVIRGINIPAAFEEIKERLTGNTEKTAAGHTPGPWKVDPQGRDRWNITSEKTGEHIATVLSSMHPGGRFDDDARLIAAAPQLLQALKEAKETLEMAERYFPKSIKNRDKFHLLNVIANSVNPAISQAEAEQ